MSDAWIELTSTATALVAAAAFLLSTDFGDRAFGRLDRAGTTMTPMTTGLLFGAVSIGMGVILRVVIAGWRPDELLVANDVLFGVGIGLIMYLGLRKRRKAEDRDR